MHSFPDFDYEALRSLAKRILSSRKTIRDDTQVKDWQLHDLLTYATREKLIVVDDLDRTFWRSENVEARNYKPESVPRYQMADALERLVTDEIKRRQALAAASAISPAHEEPQRKEKQSQKEPEVLPALDEVVKDAATFLPKLWEALAEMKPPPFNPKGEFIWPGKRGKDAVLMALADALEYRGKLAAGIDGRKVYLVLCKHFNREPVKRLDKTQGGKRVYDEYYNNEFKDRIALIK